MERLLIFSYESARADLRRIAPKAYRLQSVYSEVRRRGHASGLMRLIVEFADKNGLILILVAQEYGRDRGMSPSQLEEFYSKFGFEIMHERQLPQKMIRRPSREKQALL